MTITPQAFSFFTVGLYIAPMFIDDSHTILKAAGHKAMIAIDTTTKLVNGAILTGCIVGASGFLVDKGSTISVIDTALNIGGISISKSLVAIILLINIFEVVIMMVFVPGKKDSQIMRNCIDLVNEDESGVA